MTNWRTKFFLSFGSVIVAVASIHSAQADTNSLLPNASDPNNCSAFIQQGALNPPTPVTDTDISKVQSCIQSCSDLYTTGSSNLQDGINYCVSNLDSLYFVSIAKTTNDQVTNTMQASMISTAPPAVTTPAAQTTPPDNSAAAPPPAPLSSPSAAPAQPQDQKSNNDKKSGINWF